MQNSEQLQALRKMKTEIIEHVDFRSGVCEESTQKTLMDRLVIDVGWKGNVHLQVYDTGHRYYYGVVRNGERVSSSYYAGKCDERFYQSMQKIVNEIENGDFDKKKTRSEKVREVVQKRGLTSYMNETKWKEFVFAMTQEMPMALPYDYKTLFEDSHEIYYFGTAYDEESFNYYDFKSIEWVKIKPSWTGRIYQGKLLDDKIIEYDYEKDFVELIKKYNIPYEYDEMEKVYVIYGYK